MVVVCSRLRICAQCEARELSRVTLVFSFLFFQTVRFSENVGEIMTENMGCGGIRPEYKKGESASLTALVVR